MKLAELPLLADENIHPEVLAWCRGEGLDVASVADRGLLGRPDDAVLAAAAAEGRVVLTHDADFGTLAVAGRKPIVGIVYLRPGHIDASYTIASLRAVLAQTFPVQPPFIIVAQRAGDIVTLRVRQL